MVRGISSPDDTSVDKGGHGEGAMVGAGLDHVHAEQPTEQQVVRQFLTEGTLAAH